MFLGNCVTNGIQLQAKTGSSTLQPCSRYLIHSKIVQAWMNSWRNNVSSSWPSILVHLFRNYVVASKLDNLSSGSTHRLYLCSCIVAPRSRLRRWCSHQAAIVHLNRDWNFGSKFPKFRPPLKCSYLAWNFRFFAIFLNLVKFYSNQFKISQNFKNFRTKKNPKFPKFRFCCSPPKFQLFPKFETLARHIAPRSCRRWWMLALSSLAACVEEQSPPSARLASPGRGGVAVFCSCEGTTTITTGSPRLVSSRRGAAAADGCSHGVEEPPPPSATRVEELPSPPGARAPCWLAGATATAAAALAPWLGMERWGEETEQVHSMILV